MPKKPRGPPDELVTNLGGRGSISSVACEKNGGWWASSAWACGVGARTTAAPRPQRVAWSPCPAEG
eukprot:5083276-Prymnesium_polylepis.3